MNVYILYKMVEGEYYEWGKYTDPVKLAEAAFYLGGCDIDCIKIQTVEGEQ